MALQFILGNSGSGKSSWLYEHVLEQAVQYPDKNFLFLVPEQFTMQTQREFVDRHPAHAILNIDVLSFQRLAYRVFDDLGMMDIVVLEETEKIWCCGMWRWNRQTGCSCWAPISERPDISAK